MGNITGYSVNSEIFDEEMVNSSSTDSFPFNITKEDFPPDVFSINITVTVATINRYGEGPPSESGTMVIHGMYVYIVV